MKTAERLPQIGVVGYYISEEEAVGGHIRGIPRQAFSLFSYDMIQAVFQSGATPIPLPVVDKDKISQQLDTIDGLVFSGGEDVDPRLYGEALQPSSHRIDPVRDKYEMELMEIALERNIPILCICRGMQLLNVFCGGTLHADIGDIADNMLNHWETKEPWRSVHPVQMNADHFASAVLGGTHIEVNSIHHQSVKQLGDGLEVVGQSTDHIVEVIAMKGRSNVLALQWHPEMIAKQDDAGLRPFKWLNQLAITTKKEQKEAAVSEN